MSFGFAIMLKSNSIGGFNHIKSLESKTEALAFVDGRSDYHIWTIAEYEEWHKREIMPYYK